MDSSPALFCKSSDLAKISTEVFKGGSSLRFEARGSSMHPLIRDGDILVIESFGGVSIRIGDVVFCVPTPDHVVIHRVMRIMKIPGGNRYLIKGDQANKTDGWLNRDQIYGKVTRIERGVNIIRMEQWTMCLLSWAQLFRFRSKIGYGRISLFFWGRIRKLPIFRKYIL